MSKNKKKNGKNKKLKPNKILELITNALLLTAALIALIHEIIKLT